MNNINYDAERISFDEEFAAEKKPKTIAIDARYKEVYYQAAEPAIKESPETLKHRQVFWNYMMHVSMQNTLIQMANRTRSIA